jgi:hypothetical protein
MQKAPSIQELAQNLDNEISGLVGNWSAPKEQTRYKGDAYEKAYERFKASAEGVRDDPHSDGIKIQEVCSRYKYYAQTTPLAARTLDRVSRYFLPKIANNTGIPATIRAYASFIIATGLTNQTERVKNAIEGLKIIQKPAHTDIDAYREASVHIFNDAAQSALLQDSDEFRSQGKEIHTLLGRKHFPWLQTFPHRYNRFSLREKPLIGIAS